MLSKRPTTRRSQYAPEFFKDYCVYIQIVTYTTSIVNKMKNAAIPVLQGQPANFFMFLIHYFIYFYEVFLNVHDIL